MDQETISELSLPGLSLPKDSGKPPWHPRVSGIAGFLCGPVAAGLVAFINLRRLNERRKAIWTLTLTILASAALGLVITRVPENVSTTLATLIGNFISPFVYPFLQWRAFEEWVSSHPGAARDHGWRSSGWAILGLAAFFVIAVGAALAFSRNEVRDIEVRYYMPETGKVGEDVVLTVTVQNTTDHPQLLYSLDFDTHFLEGISIRGANPAFKTSEPNLLAPIRSYIFRQDIPSKGELNIDLDGRAQRPGTYPLKLDVCVKTELACSTFELGTITVH